MKQNNKKPVLVYRSQNSNSGLQELVRLSKEYARKKYPSVPEYARPRPNYSDTTANGLTKMIVDFLNFSGHQAERVTSSGRWIEGEKLETDVIGRQRVAPGKFIPPSSTNGTADISATIRGRSIKIEIKIGRDKQSEKQKLYQASVESAGGVYVIARDFETWYSWYVEYLKGVS